MLSLQLAVKSKIVSLMVAKKQFGVSPAMMAILEKTLREILEERTFIKVATRRLTLTTAELDTRLAIKLAIMNKCLLAIVALYSVRARVNARGKTTSEAAMKAWVELMMSANQEILDWIEVGATPGQMALLQLYGITPEQVGKYLRQANGQATIAKLVEDPGLLKFI